jgi:hypothetical protein
LLTEGRHVRLTAPVKPPSDVNVIVDVLPVVAPDTNARLDGLADSVNGVAAVTLIVDDAVTVPFVPVTVTLPEPTAVGVQVSVAVAVPPEVSATDSGDKLQPAVFTGSVSVNVPANGAVDVNVITSVTGTPTYPVRLDVAGVTENWPLVTTSEAAVAVVDVAYVVSPEYVAVIEYVPADDGV